MRIPAASIKLSVDRTRLVSTFLQNRLQLLTPAGKSAMGACPGVKGLYFARFLIQA